MNLFRAARHYYRRIVTPAVRDPFGLARRYLMDDLRRLVASPPLPSRAHLRQIQTTPFLEEYLRVGRAAAAAVNRSFARHGVAAGSRVLDFGCGSGRVSRHLARQWDLYGCDVDAAAIRWSNANLPGTFVTNGARPPLPFPDSHFQAVLSVSVFTHLDWDAQRAWAAEMGRLLSGGGVLVISALSERVLDSYPSLDSSEHRQLLAENGFLFIDGGEHFSSKSAVHTAGGLTTIFADEFDLVEHLPAGLDGFQDLAIFRRKRA